ncbi:MAG: alpha hydrolase [Candidatus Methanomethylicota archaeon]|uniref:Alpha hydrolase n=1 Tax=Thermoproteota archaeon TaxID=2056631 RepID=A0A497EXL8_9CREN|nr:MAG: alpha hydrolase [Candidatus Verstraetearchaeota archaeon]
MSMKCVLCSSQATVYLKHSGLKLCDQHFKSYFLKQVRKTVEKYKLIEKGDKVLIAVSGGKDSASMLYALKQLYGDACSLIALHIDLGIKGYSEHVRQVVSKQCDAVGIELKVVKLSDYGFTIDQAYSHKKALKRPICSICGTAKRYVLNYEAVNLRANKVATGHNLDDNVVFALTNYASGNMNLLIKEAPIAHSTHPKLVTKIKPLYYIYEAETELFCSKIGLPIDELQCPYRAEAISILLKEDLKSIEEKLPGFMKSFMKNHYKLVKPALENISKLAELELKTCKVCGMPSSANVCAFCKIRSKISELGSLRENC